MANPSKDRLNQIAERKLSSLGVPVQTTADLDLVGELRTGGGVLRFVVVDHDKLRFDAKPFDLLGPVLFYDCATVAALEQRLRKMLDDRGVAAQQAAAKLRVVGVEAGVDGDRFVAVGSVQAGPWRFDLEADAQGARVVRLAQGRRTLELPDGVGALRLESFRSRIDFEIHLGARAAEWERAGEEHGRVLAAARRRTETAMRPIVLSAAPDVAARLQPQRASTETPCLGELVAKLGPLAVPNRLEIVQDYLLGAQRWRFVATHEAGTRFKGAVYDASSTSVRPIWSDVFDLSRVGDLSDVVAWVIGGQDGGAQSAAPTLPSDEIPEHLVPHAGEVWVMTVQIEEDDGATIRYVVVDVDGRPYGGPRALPRPDFAGLFQLHGAAHRMRIVVEDVRGPEVVYRQLDPAGQVTGDARRLATAQLVTTFVPEAGAY